MRGQIQPWFNILDFETLESMMRLALELKEDVCFSFFLSVPNYQQNGSCCVFGHLCSKFVSSRVPESFSWRREVRTMFIWTASDTISFFISFSYLSYEWNHLYLAFQRPKFLCPLDSHAGRCCLLSPGLPMQRERRAGRRQRYPPLLRLWQIWQSVWVLSLAKVKIRWINKFIMFAMKNILACLHLSARACSFLCHST